MKKILYSSLIVAAFVTTIFIACSKEDNIVPPTKNENVAETMKSTMAEMPKFFAEYVDGEYVYNFDRNDASKRLSEAFSGKCGDEVLVESISIEDEDPCNINEAGFLRVSIINVDRNDAVTIYIKTLKFIKEGKTCYADGNNGVAYICAQKDCKGTCKLSHTRTNNTDSYSCTCLGKEGHCELDVPDTGGHDWFDYVSLGVGVVGIILAIVLR